MKVGGKNENVHGKNVDTYIAKSKEEARPILKELREVARATIPEVEERISWGMPFYRYHGLLAGFAVLKNHVDFGFYHYFTDEDRKAFHEAGYTTGKKVVRINFDQKVPAAIIRRILKTRAEANIAKAVHVKGKTTK